MLLAIRRNGFSLFNWHSNSTPPGLGAMLRLYHGFYPWLFELNPFGVLYRNCWLNVIIIPKGLNVISLA